MQKENKEKPVKRKMTVVVEGSCIENGKPVADERIVKVKRIEKQK